MTISVGALLRREGRGPHAADRPLTPRGHSRPAVVSPRPPRRSARKAAAAAGALIAAGAVFSGTVVDTVRTPRGAVDFASDPRPSTGSGTLDRTRSPEPGRPGRRITVTALAQLFTPGTTAAIEYGPPASGTQIGRDAFGAPN